MFAVLVVLISRFRPIVAVSVSSMACFKPLTAWQLDDGSIVFVERSGNIRRQLELPCGQCVGCRLERSRQWAVRCMHESQMHEHSCFVTLTYDDSHYTPSLDYGDFQAFMRRLRKRLGKARFYMCGEYGERTSRPHFHACLFGVFFKDRTPFMRTGSGSMLYRSKILEELWPFGFSSIGDVTFESAAYVARYVLKKVTGPLSEEHYKRVNLATGEIIDVVPEFCRMSLRPGIGFTWWQRYQSEVLCRDRVVIRGVEVKPPRYYDKLLKEDNGFRFDEVEFDRFKRSLNSLEDQTPERLAVRERVASARLSHKVRSL